MRALLLVLVCWALTAVEPPSPADMAREVEMLPVQDEGRIKPLASLARVWLLAVHERERLKLPVDDGPGSPAGWLLQLLCDQDAAYALPVFTERNPAVIEALGLEPRTGNCYSFDELRAAVDAHREQLIALHQRTPDSLDVTETGMIDMLELLQAYYALSQSLTPFLPEFTVGVELAAELGLAAGDYSHFELQALLPRISAIVDTARGTAPDALSPLQLQAMLVYGRMHEMRQHAAQMLALIPPEEGDRWLHPWQLAPDAGYDSEVAAGWQALARAYRAGDLQALAAARERVLTALPNEVDTMLLGMEVSYLDAGWFGWAKALYLLAILLLALRMMVATRWLSGGALLAVGAALVLQVIGIALRVWIMQRPPVATLYESTIFVSAVAMAASLGWELFRRDALPLFVGAVIACGLLFVADAYADDGDTMGMLQAVLNSRFWLTTHVLTIAIGYSIALVAGVAGHCYLGAVILWPEDGERHRGIERAMHGINLVGLFFVLVGTILGGIWADQSWGRFWGWDPKENGALWIVLWQLMLLHLRLAGALPPLRYAAGLVLLNVVVILAWFGVNLLGVGLHSYGFADSVVRNLVIFVVAEILIAGLLWAVAQQRKAALTRSPGSG